jgi:hypothetical protein
MGKFKIKLSICCLLLLLLSGSLLTPSSLGQSDIKKTEVESKSQIEESLIDEETVPIIQAWFHGQKAREAQDLTTARAIYEKNAERIKQMPSHRHGECFLAFNQVLLESTYTNELPDFTPLDSRCFDTVILLIARYSSRLYREAQ